MVHGGGGAYAWGTSLNSPTYTSPWLTKEMAKIDAIALTSPLT